MGANQPAVSKTATKTRPASSTSRAASRGNGSATRTKSKKEAKTLSAFITERFDEFSRSQKDVARYIVDHLDEAAFQTAEELARRASTSSSTVVRFSQALGFEGYPELQQAAIEEYRSRPSENGATEKSSLFDFDHSEFEASLAADHGDLEDTVRNLSADQIEACVEALANANRVMIVGMDQLAFFASYLRHLLALLDIRAEVVAQPQAGVDHPPVPSGGGCPRYRLLRRARAPDRRSRDEAREAPAGDHARHHRRHAV